MKIDVKANTKKNVVVGVINKTVLLVLPFFTKKLINIYLGAEYLGLNSLFTSILSVLSLTELGVSGAMVYHMYKPIANDDYPMLCALLNFYRKVYVVIGLVTTVLGILVLPVLPQLVKGSYPSDINIYVIYLFQLASNVIGYFLFGYKQSLLAAYQREDINSFINLFTQGGMQLLQLALLVVTRNYYFYVICLPIFTIVNNLWIEFFTRKLYPTVTCKGKIDSSVLASIKKLVAGSFIQRACAVSRNSLDSVCISAFVGLTLTGIYNNYYTVFNGITVMLSIIIASLTGGIGNHVAIKSVDENYKEFEAIDQTYLLISGWCTCCLLCLSQPFMRLWMGKDMQMSDLSVGLMCLYFYMLKVGDVRGIYYSTTGMWWKMRYRSIAETVCNLVLNLAFGFIFGINGIITATVISLFFFNFLWGSKIVFHNYFGDEKLKKYFRYQLKSFVFSLILCISAFWITNKIVFDSAALELVVRGSVCACYSLIACFLIVRKNKSIKSIFAMIRK